LTDKKGIANFNFKIIKGIDTSAVSIVCELNGVKTPLSNTIIVRNKLSEVQFISDISEERSIEFRHDENGN
jgi:hypothetical protein